MIKSIAEHIGIPVLGSYALLILTLFHKCLSDAIS